MMIPGAKDVGSFMEHLLRASEILRQHVAAISLRWDLAQQAGEGTWWVEPLA